MDRLTYRNLRKIQEVEDKRASEVNQLNIDLSSLQKTKEDLEELLATEQRVQEGNSTLNYNYNLI